MLIVHKIALIRNAPKLHRKNTIIVHAFIYHMINCICEKYISNCSFSAWTTKIFIIAKFFGLLCEINQYSASYRNFQWNAGYFLLRIIY